MRYLILALTMLFPFGLQADVLKINGNTQVITSSDVPSRGMTKSEVRKRYGEPSSKKAAVGQPPISRWDYPGFSVFFEYHIVLHTVVDKS